jgi:hypothetical protein
MEKRAAEMKRLVAEAEAIDQGEDAQYGNGQRGDELPEELQFKQERLSRIEGAKAVLECEAREKANQERLDQDREREDRETSTQRRGRKPKALSERPMGTLSATSRTLSCRS